MTLVVSVGIIHGSRTGQRTDCSRLSSRLDICSDYISANLGPRCDAFNFKPVLPHNMDVDLWNKKTANVVWPSCFSLSEPCDVIEANKKVFVDRVYEADENNPETIDQYGCFYKGTFSTGRQFSWFDTNDQNCANAYCNMMWELIESSQELYELVNGKSFFSGKPSRVSTSLVKDTGYEGEVV